MASGATAGLQTSEQLRHENTAAREKQETYYRDMAPGVSGKGAETVYRDKEGKRIDPKLERLKMRQEEREKMENDAQFMEWGRGVAQVRQAQEKLVDEAYEMTKPLARYRDDEDLERMLKERERAGDPMLAFLKKKNVPKTATGKPKKERPSYKGPCPVNRFGIWPGYRWDRVDRSNGYEKTWFARESNKKAIADESYKWSVEDM